MFDKEVYVERRRRLKHDVGTGVMLFLGNDELSTNYAANTFTYRQDSTFLYFFGQAYPGLAAVIDIDEDREIIFGDELTIDDIVWMGNQPTLHEKSANAGISETRPAAELAEYLRQAASKGRRIH